MDNKKNSEIRVCLVQDAPVLFHKEKTFQKMEGLVKEIGANAPDIVVFPEAFIPGYPRGFSFGSVIGSRSDAGRNSWKKYQQEAVNLEAADGKRLAKMAQQLNALLAVGVVEVSETGTLYCTLVMYNASGKRVYRHRKLKPTAAERIVWGEGNGDDLEVSTIRDQKIGGLICWENYMPEARMALYKQGISIWIAPTADARESWQWSMRHIAVEGRCFVLSCNQFVQKENYPDWPDEELNAPALLGCRGGSLIADPFGNLICGPVWDKAELIWADINPDEIIRSKLDFDVAGHYARPDVFDFKWLKKPS